MEADKKTAINIKKISNMGLWAKIALILIMLNVVSHLAAIYQTRYQMVSPLIPESAIWEINKQFVFQAIVSASVSMLGLILYFFGKYVFVVILVVLTLIISRYLYLR